MWNRNKINEEESVNTEKHLKVGAVSPRIRLGDIAYNVDQCINEAKRAAEMGVELLVFPKLTLTGATCRDLLLHSVFGERAERALEEFIAKTRELDMVSVIGLPDSEGGELLAVVYKGKLSSIIQNVDSYYEFEGYKEHRDGTSVRFAGQRAELEYDSFMMPSDDYITVGVFDLFDDYTGPHVVINPSANETIIGSRADEVRLAKRASYNNDAVYILANAGMGESTTDAVYSAHNIIASNGKILAEAEPFAEDNLTVADVLITEDADFEYAEELEEENGKSYKSAKLEKRRDFFLPVDDEERRIACLEALEIQAQGLAARIERSYSKAMVIGVSGGLDSTLALLVCARAADILGMDRKSIIGVTMPCFGTTKRTKSNAEKLCEALGTTLRVVDIKASVTQHLKDIGHDTETPDVTFENAQARERTQVIMDIANMTGGLVVGTGDLSELALGWATYNGDHMSMYGVNGSIPKTLVRHLVQHYADTCESKELAAVLLDVLDTPVSPELLPPVDGSISQKTEDLVGPYELHDFFLYYMLRFGFGPKKIFRMALYTFAGIYEEEVIRKWLKTFCRRFFTQQFKRSCLPDGPKVGTVGVSPRGDLKMPSDASMAAWQKELETI